MEINKVYLGDCIDVMTTFPNECIDLTVTSPPYDNMRTYNNTCEWNFDVFKKIAKELFRITKLGGVVVWIVSDSTNDGTESGTSFKQALYFKEIGFNLHDTMIWAKDGGGAIGSNLCYTQNFEYMFVLTKGKPQHVNLIADKKNLSFGQKKSTGRRYANGDRKIEPRMVCSEYSRRNNWWLVVPQKQEGSDWHPAVFPESIALDHIRTWSNEGDIVLDPFLGSGTTAKMAVKAKRKYIGIEKCEEYFKLAKKRIWNEERQLTLF